MNFLTALRRWNARDKRRYELLKAERKGRRRSRRNAVDERLEQDFPSARAPGKFFPFW